MSTVRGDRSWTEQFAHLSPLVLVAVAMPWILEWTVVETVLQFAPAYEPLVTEGLVGSVLYPAVTGSATLLGLYAILDSETRRSLFLFRRPSRQGLLAVGVAVVVGILLAFLAQAAVIAVLGAEPASAPVMEFDLVSLVTLAAVGCVFAPLVEEVLFRGLLLGYLLERDVPTVAAGGTVVVAFGAIHHYGGSGHIVSAAVFGAVLVALRLRYDNLALPVLAHALNNLVWGILIPFFLLT